MIHPVPSLHGGFMRISYALILIGLILIILGSQPKKFKINDSDLHSFADKTVEYVWYEEPEGVALYFFFTDGSWVRILPGLELEIHKKRHPATDPPCNCSVCLCGRNCSCEK